MRIVLRDYKVGPNGSIQYVGECYEMPSKLHAQNGGRVYFMTGMYIGSIKPKQQGRKEDED